MPTITTSDAARALGATRTPKKAESSRRNLAKARATISAALAAYKAAPQPPLPPPIATDEPHTPPPSSVKSGEFWCRQIDGRQTTEFMAYRGAENRCTNPNSDNWERYGGRGIKFLFESFEAFMDEIGPKPSPELQLDRINNDGNYEPGNVRWATALENTHNRACMTNSPTLFIGANHGR
jgi:hypothetical protein